MLQIVNRCINHIYEFVDSYSSTRCDIENPGFFRFTGKNISINNIFNKSEVSTLFSISTYHGAFIIQNCSYEFWNPVTLELFKLKGSFTLLGILKIAARWKT